MKDYINMFHAIVSEIHFWDDHDISKKKDIISKFLENFKNNEELLEYFENFYLELKKKSLNSYLKSVIRH